MRATVTGNLVRDAELKFTNSGKAVCNFTVADSYKPNRDAEEQVVYMDVVMWGSLAENFVSSLKKGQRVICEGRVQQRNWETDKGEKRSKYELVADSAGPDLRWQTAEVHHRTTNGSAGTSESRPFRPQFDEEPF